MTQLGHVVPIKQWKFAILPSPVVHGHETGLNGPKVIDCPCVLVHLSVGSSPQFITHANSVPGEGSWPHLRILPFRFPRPAVRTYVFLQSFLFLRFSQLWRS